MNGLRTSLWRCRRPYEARPEDNHVSKPFFISFPVVARKSNPWRPLRHGVDRMAQNLSPKRMKARQRGQRIAFRGQKPARASNEIKDGRRRIDFIGGRFRRESAEIRMRIRMHFRLRRAEEASMPTGGRAKAGFRWLPYAAVCAVCGSLKRKKAGKTPTPKRGA